MCMWFVSGMRVSVCVCVSLVPRLSGTQNKRGEPGIFSHVIIKVGPEFLEQKGNVLGVIQPALRSTLGVYSPPDIYIHVVSCLLPSLFSQF